MEDQKPKNAHSPVLLLRPQREFIRDHLRKKQIKASASVVEIQPVLLSLKLKQKNLDAAPVDESDKL